MVGIPLVLVLWRKTRMVEAREGIKDIIDTHNTHTTCKLEKRSLLYLIPLTNPTSQDAFALEGIQ